ncbi:hypothetical protein [uncultured Chryseobacterium sp.]|uniref:hypothetical protein n=1 Tax=uncultured Chryseobacterium sp. TaxID=259322 RepID=UPI002624CFC6|nr:hypothetical protein [uncultured Chryseobacterium sp.]
MGTNKNDGGGGGGSLWVGEVTADNGITMGDLIDAWLNNNSTENMSSESDDPIAYLTNNSEYTIYFKPEGDITINGVKYSEDGSYPLAAGKSWYYPVDGVAAPHINKEQVFKLSDGMSLEVTNKSYNWTYKSGGFLRSLGSYTSMYGGDSLGLNTILTKDTGGWKTANWVYLMSANSITKTHNSWSSGTIISTESKIAAFNWINLFISSGLKKASSYRQPHTYNIISYGR